ncbi:GNAT family N-acetyltransferase [Muribaculum intestinale]|uniref:GNAT family N-acetyltransferase n=1 Tax=Muribaculum intestinale TaxID=1796646 RepID=UPI002639DEA7|nr:GNAT family N-acetyltransferase [Muribaculum intestinale]
MAADSKIIETERLVLRPWHDNDADSLYRYASDKRVCELALWPCHTSPEMSLEVIETIFKPNPHSFAMAAKESDEAIGCIGLVPEGDGHYPLAPAEREVGYWIGYPWWGRGLTTEALGALIGYCRDVLHIDSLVITTDAENRASQRVARKCGFVFVEDYIYGGISSKAYRLHLKNIEATGNNGTQAGC